MTVGGVITNSSENASIQDSQPGYTDRVPLHWGTPMRDEHESAIAAVSQGGF